MQCGKVLDSLVGVKMFLYGHSQWSEDNFLYGHSQWSEKFSVWLGFYMWRYFEKKCFI